MLLHKQQRFSVKEHKNWKGHSLRLFARIPGRKGKRSEALNELVSQQLRGMH